MAEDTGIRERIVRIETKLADMEPKINEMHAAFLQSKGAFWIVGAAAGLIGFLLSLAVKFLPFLNGPMPK